MSDELKYFPVGQRVIVHFNARWGGVSKYREGVVAKHYKRGSFIVQYDGEDKPDQQQWRSAFVIRDGDTPSASQTGNNYGAFVYPDCAPIRAKMQGAMDAAKLQSRLFKVQKLIGDLKAPNGSDAKETFDFDGLVGALENALGVKGGSLTNVQ
jgi:hypothetical protein